MSVQCCVSFPLVAVHLLKLLLGCGNSRVVQLEQGENLLVREIPEMPDNFSDAGVSAFLEISFYRFP